MDGDDLAFVACSVCGAEPPANSRFCPRCGSALGPGGVEPIVVATAPEDGYSPRVMFGVIPADVIAVLMVVTLVASIVLLERGHFISGSVFLVVAVAFGRLLTSSASRLPDSRFGRALAAAGGGTRVRSELAATLVASWTWAGREIIRLRRERRGLERDRVALIRRLGEASYAADEELIARYRAEVHACVQRIETCMEEEQSARAAAHTRVERERTSIRPTQTLVADHGPGGGDSRPTRSNGTP